MRVLVIDTDGVGLAFCWRCAQAGHEVRWFLKDDPHLDKDIGKGFKGVTRIPNWVASAQWADLIFPTSNDAYTKRLDFFRKNGAMVFGPTEKSAELEISRSKGMKFMEKNGIKVPPYKMFKSLEEAEQHVWKTEERFVFKTMGDGDDTKRTFCAESPASMIAFLQRLQKQAVQIKGEVMLQTFIDGIEMGVSRYMGTKGYIGMWNENFEHKKMMPSNAGMTTGETGTVIKYTKESKLGQVVMNPIEKALVEMGHIGDIDLNCIINPKGDCYPLEFTARPGWPFSNIAITTHKGDPVQWMLDALRGKDTLTVSEDHAIGVVVWSADFPNTKMPPEEVNEIPIYGVTKRNEKYIQPQHVMIKDMPDGTPVKVKPIWVTAGNYNAVVTGRGESVKQAAERAYGTVKEISIKDKGFRDDIGEELKGTLPKLQTLGFATSFKYE
jgi:phosphoribosylamine--glycine ligase